MHAACDPGGERGAQTVDSSLPFPWQLEVRRASGGVLGSFTVDGSAGPQQILALMALPASAVEDARAELLRRLAAPSPGQAEARRKRQLARIERLREL